MRWEIRIGVPSPEQRNDGPGFAALLAADYREAQRAEKG
jgi:hypothetical protein